MIILGIQQLPQKTFRKALEHCKVDLFNIAVDNKESDDIFKSFFKAGVAEN